MNIESLVKVKPNRKIPELAPGDTVKVRAVEGSRIVVKKVRKNRGKE